VLEVAPVGPRFAPHEARKASKAGRSQNEGIPEVDGAGGYAAVGQQFPEVADLVGDVGDDVQQRDCLKGRRHDRLIELRVIQRRFGRVSTLAARQRDRFDITDKPAPLLVYELGRESALKNQRDEEFPCVVDRSH